MLATRLQTHQMKLCSRLDILVIISRCYHLFDTTLLTDMILRTSTSVEDNNDRDENLTGKRTPNGFPHAKTKCLCRTTSIPVGNCCYSRKPEGQISPVIPSSIGELQWADIIVIQPHLLSMYIGSPLCLEMRRRNALLEATKQTRHDEVVPGKNCKDESGVSRQV